MLQLIIKGEKTECFFKDDVNPKYISNWVKQAYNSDYVIKKVPDNNNVEIIKVTKHNFDLLTKGYTLTFDLPKKSNVGYYVCPVQKSITEAARRYSERHNFKVFCARKGDKLIIKTK